MTGEPSVFHIGGRGRGPQRCRCLGFSHEHIRGHPRRHRGGFLRRTGGKQQPGLVAGPCRPCTRSPSRSPLTALLAQLEPQFGPGKIFRPNRDIRFSQDKSPYKTAQGAFASFQEGVGYYLQLSADGLLVGGGYHSHSPAQLARYRNSVDATGTGEQLQHIVDGHRRRRIHG